MEKLIEMSVADAVTEKPIEFKIGRRKFKMSPPSIGKMQILSKYYLMLEIREEQLQEEPQTEAMRICEAHSDVVAELMSVATFNKKEDLLDSNKIKERAEYFKWNSEPRDFTMILLSLLAQLQYENFISSIRLTEILRQNKPKSKS